MNVEFINPFLASTVNVIRIMTFTDPRPEKPFQRQHENASLGDITGVIGLTGAMNASMALSFSETAILYIVSNMFGEACKEIDIEVQDAVGELTNMICGDARRILAENGLRFEGAIPTVITGRKHQIAHTVPGPTIVAPFGLGEHGSFFVEVCFEKGPT